MEGDKLGPILRPLFKNIKSLFKDIVQADAVLGFRKGPAGDINSLKPILWDKAFGCRINVEGVTEKGLFVLIERNGGIFLSAKLLVLPQNNIDELMKKSEVNESILDAQKEIFNMLVGKINDILMEKVENTIHLLMEENFIVNEKDISFLPADQEYVSYTASVKIVGPVQFSMALIISRELENFILKHISSEYEESLMQDTKEDDHADNENALSDTLEEENISKLDQDNSRHKLRGHVLKEIIGGKAEIKYSFLDYLMEEDFPVAQIGTSIWDALIKMQTYGVDYIVLVDGLKFIGLLSMADIRRGLSPFIEEPFKEYCREQDLATKSFNIEWFLEKEIKPVPHDVSLEEVINIYLSQDTPYLPVCKNYRIIGVITHKKMIQFLTELLYEIKKSSADTLITDNTANVTSDQAMANM